MPQGSAHELPSGIWVENPAKANYSYLIGRSIGRFVQVGIFVFCFDQFRSILWKYTNKQFIGRTLTLRNMSMLEHDPLPPEEIDRMLAEQAEANKSGNN